MKPIDAYTARYPANVKRYLQQLRALITATAPSAEEAMRYGIPTFRYLKKNLVHFGGFKDHVSFFRARLAFLHLLVSSHDLKCPRGPFNSRSMQSCPLRSFVALFVSEYSNAKN